MIRDALEYLAKLGGDNEPITVGTGTYLPPGYSSSNFARLPDRPALHVGTLDALIGYLSSDPDGIFDQIPFIHIVDPVRVDVLGPYAPTIGRDCFLRANYQPPGFVLDSVFDGYVPVETAVIELTAHCDDSDDRAAVLKILGTVADEVVKTQADDGVTQTATVKSGIAGFENMSIPTTVLLRPFRTFPEVEQPAGAFILRLKKGPRGIEATLVEADNASWRLDAVESIRKYLRTTLGDAKVILA